MRVQFYFILYSAYYLKWVFRQLCIACVLVCSISHQICANSLSDLDTRYFLRLYDENLRTIHNEILQGSMKNGFLRFRGYQLIDYNAYKALSPRERNSITKPLIFLYGTLVSKPSYQEVGGISIIAQPGDNDEKPIHLQFQGRYFTDLLSIGIDGRFYALCVPPKMQQCLLIGIGERW